MIQKYFERQRNTLSYISKVVWDMETLEVVEREVHYYDGPWELCKESDAQRQAQAQQNAFNNQLLQIFQTQFAAQQDILKVLTPQLEEMAKYPEGFGTTEYAALQSKIVNDTGAQYSNVAKEAAREFATTNEAGLPSGVEAQVQANIAGAAAGQVVSGSQNLAIQNEMLKQQQKQFALSALSGESGMLGQQALVFGSQEGAGLQNQFQNATTVYNQGSLWKNILGGVVGAGLNLVAPGFGTAVGGAISGPQQG